MTTWALFDHDGSNLSSFDTVVDALAIQAMMAMQYGTPRFIVLDMPVRYAKEDFPNARQILDASACLDDPHATVGNGPYVPPIDMGCN